MKPGTGHKMLTPEDARKTMKRNQIINWVIFFGVLLLVTIGILELLTMNSQ
ncbi:MAG: hypothetical protein V4642_06510 [Bacteroidota bacterium]